MESEKALDTTLSSADEIDLVEVFFFILKKIKVVIASAAAGLLIAFVYAYILATPVYEATSQLYVVNSKDSVLNLSDLQIGSYLASDYQLVFRTWEVNQQVIENLDLPYDVAKLRSMLTVTNPSNTRALSITVRSSNPQEAADIANEFADVAKKYISDTMLTDMPSTLSEALKPTRPVSPKKFRIMALGALLAMVAAIGVLFIIFVRDDKIKTATDVEKYSGMSPLAVIPLMWSDSSHTSKRR